MAGRLALFSTKSHDWSKLSFPDFCIRHHRSAAHEFRMLLSSEFHESIVVDRGKVLSPHNGTRRRIQHDEIYHLVKLLWPCFRRANCRRAPVHTANELSVWSPIALPAECRHLYVAELWVPEDGSLYHQRDFVLFPSMRQVVCTTISLFARTRRRNLVARPTREGETRFGPRPADVTLTVGIWYCSPHTGS
jgi:hypothetical protein